MDKALQKAQTRERVKRYRDKQKSVTSASVTGDSVTQDVTVYPSIINALADPVKRDKLERICDSLGKRRLLGQVYYGAGKHSITMDTVSELLEATT